MSSNSIIIPKERIDRLGTIPEKRLRQLTDAAIDVNGVIGNLDKAQELANKLQHDRLNIGDMQKIAGVISQELLKAKYELTVTLFKLADIGAKVQPVYKSE